LVVRVRLQCCEVVNKSSAGYGLGRRVGSRIGESCWMLWLHRDAGGSCTLLAHASESFMGAEGGSRDRIGIGSACQGLLSGWWLFGRPKNWASRGWAGRTTQASDSPSPRAAASDGFVTRYTAILRSRLRSSRHAPSRMCYATRCSPLTSTRPQARCLAEVLYRSQNEGKRVTPLIISQPAL